MTVTAAVIVATTRVYDMPGLLALAPWADDETLIEWQLAQVLAAGIRDVEVVIPPDGDAIIPLVARDNVEPVIDTPNTGVASAIQAGVIALPRGTTEAVILTVAEPVNTTGLRGLISEHEGRGYGMTGWRSLPFVGDEDVLAALRNVNNAEGLRLAFETFVRGGIDEDRSIGSRETYERYRDALT